MAGAPKGNTNARKENRVWGDAIRRAVARRGGLNKIADKLLDKCEEGDLQALKELGDRIDGKPVQAIEGTGPNGAITVEVVKFANQASS